MFSLPDEVQFDVLKCLNFNQLCSVRLTNFYFCNLINKYERGLARKKFEAIFIKIEETHLPKLYKFVELESGIFEITLNDQLKEKWQAAIDKSIPLFLYNSGPNRNFIRIQKTFSGSQDEKTPYLLILPNIPKNIKEMIIARCWLEHLFKCAFKWSIFKCIFNPQMINILFDNDKSIPLQFNIELTNVSVRNKNFENILNFSFNHLSNTHLNLNINEDITEQHTNILFNKIINQGNKFPQISLNNFNFERLYDLIREYIATSRDCSKMAPVITLLSNANSTSHKLSERAEKVEIKQEGRIKYTSYEISNIYNSNVRFSFCIEERNFVGSYNWFKIRKMKV
uniref:F-box domain-containing protein n=1 Tax=Meloidogyne enterolobii TaxID=390850 RepID=A0A6V7TML8_MELEN|nr:unnamed protein product [Meloidogyne enterolobii]